jgi:hypothetical protein
VIAMQPIHILSDGWEPHVYYSEKDLVPIDFRNESFIANGQLHLNKSLLAKRQVHSSKYFFSRITNSQEFNVSSDNFSLVTRMKVDSVLDNLCPWMNLLIVTEKHIFNVAFNGEAAFQEVFKEDFGKIVGLLYIFEGTGSLDYVTLTGADGQTVVEDDFE